LVFPDSPGAGRSAPTPSVVITTSLLAAQLKRGDTAMRIKLYYETLGTGRPLILLPTAAGSRDP